MWGPKCGLMSTLTTLWQLLPLIQTKMYFSFFSWIVSVRERSRHVVGPAPSTGHTSLIVKEWILNKRALPSSPEINVCLLRLYSVMVVVYYFLPNFIHLTFWYIKLWLYCRRNNPNFRVDMRLIKFTHST